MLSLNNRRASGIRQAEKGEGAMTVNIRLRAAAWAGALLCLLGPAMAAPPQTEPVTSTRA